jgi:L-alanine-DL-glutamate epimerase-like enolase superfamily enzyme
MITAGAVDVLMADATRCGGITGFLKASQLAEAFNLPVSSHTAPSIHLQPAASLPHFKTLEYFYDHVRIEKMLLDGYIEPVDGYLEPDLSRPGLGWNFKKKDAEKFKVY